MLLLWALRSKTAAMPRLHPMFLLPVLAVAGCIDDPVHLNPPDTSLPETDDTGTQDTGTAVDDSELFAGRWELVFVDDTDSDDTYPFVEEVSGCLEYRGWYLNVEPDFSGTFQNYLNTQCPGQDLEEEILETTEMKGAHISGREWTIRINVWALALTCTMGDDSDKVSCWGEDDSGPLVLEFERRAD